MWGRIHRLENQNDIAIIIEIYSSALKHIYVGCNVGCLLFHHFINHTCCHGNYIKNNIVKWIRETEKCVDYSCGNLQVELSCDCLTH